MEQIQLRGGSVSQCFLFNNLSSLEKKEYLIIFDFYHCSSTEEEEQSLFQAYLKILKEYSYLDSSILYLLFLKTQFLEKLHIEDFLNQNENVFLEDKLSNIHFITGFSIALNITTYIFANQATHSSSWLKLNDKAYSSRIKSSQFEYLQITLDYLLKDKKRKYEQMIQIKKPSRLSMLLDGENVNARDESAGNMVATSKKNEKEVVQFQVLQAMTFQKMIENAKNLMVKSLPRDYNGIKNIISNIVAQNFAMLSKEMMSSSSVSAESAEILLLRELLSQEILINHFLLSLINHNVIKNLREIDMIQEFTLNPILIEEASSELGKIKHQSNININRNIPKHTKKKKEQSSQMFSINETSEAEYKSLILNSPTICEFVKKAIMKILSNIGLANIEKIPTNPSKYKNFVHSFVNNQELLKISKNILQLDYEKLVNVLTEGIIIEFMKKNLVTFLSSTQIHYDINQIEQEKFRLSNLEKVIMK